MNKQQEADLKKANGRIAYARALVRKKSPYITATLYGLVFHPVWEPSHKIAVTERLVAYFNPTWIVSDPELQGEEGKEVLAGVIFHECWHPLHNYHRRADALLTRGTLHGLNAQETLSLANIADDININDMARRAGFKLPSWVVYPETHGVKTGILEETWQALVDKKKSSGSLLQGELKPCSGNCSSGGVSEGGQEGEKRKKIEEELDAAFGRHNVDIDRIQRVTAEDMAAHENRNGAGTVPGFSEAKFDFKREKPLVRWESKMRHIVNRCSGNTAAGDDEYSMLRPDKNSSLLGICMPSLIEQEPEVAFIRDTSASMNLKMLNTVNNQIVQVINALGLSHVWLLDADTEVQGKPKRITSQALTKLPFKGRGGTSFVEPIEKVMKLTPRPDIVLYLTDGEGTAAEKAPRGVHVVWCIVPGGYPMRPASWGHYVVCSNDRKTREKWEKVLAK